jgi:hypothetical protein
MFGYTLPNSAMAKSPPMAGPSMACFASPADNGNLNSFSDYNNSNEFLERPDVVGNPFAGTGGQASC